MKFSILIPTWNNLPYLQQCISSIKEHSSASHQLIIIVNEGKDGTVEWLQNEKIEYVHHQENVGICTSLNSATELITEEHLIYLNDDMYVLPDWDSSFEKCIQTIDKTSFMLSGTMIEPHDTGNSCALVADFGTDIESFKKQNLLDYHSSVTKKDWCGSSWPPILLPTALWKKVDGMSEEFSPGMYSDPDLSMKVWRKGTRYFRGLGDSRVYHFGSKSTRKLGKNVGRSIFLKKWKITARYFYQKYLRMSEDWDGPLSDYKEPLSSKLIHKIKLLRS